MNATRLGMIVATVAVATLTFAKTSYAEIPKAEPKIELLASQVSVMNEQRDVEIRYETHASMSGICDLTLYSFDYDTESNSLSLITKSEEPCLNESFGKRTGATVWRVPHDVIGKSATLVIFMNGEKAGQLTVKDGTAYIVPEIKF